MLSGSSFGVGLRGGRAGLMLPSFISLQTRFSKAHLVLPLTPVRGGCRPSDQHADAVPA